MPNDCFSIRDLQEAGSLREAFDTGLCRCFCQCLWSGWHTELAAVANLHEIFTRFHPVKLWRRYWLLLTSNTRLHSHSGSIAFSNDEERTLMRHLPPNERQNISSIRKIRWTGIRTNKQNTQKQTLSLSQSTLMKANNTYIHTPAIDRDKDPIISSSCGFWRPVLWIETDRISSFVSGHKYDISYRRSEFSRGLHRDAPGPPVCHNATASQRTLTRCKLLDLHHKKHSQIYPSHLRWKPACAQGNSPLQPRSCISMPLKSQTGEITNLISCMFSCRWRSSPGST